MMSGDSDVEMRDALQQMSDDTEMKDAHQQTSDDIEMIDATTVSCSNDTLREAENRSPKKCLEEGDGADSSKQGLEKPQSTHAKVKDSSAKERVEESQSTPESDNIFAKVRVEEPQEPQSTPANEKDYSEKERVEDSQSPPGNYKDKSEEASKKKSILLSGNSEDKSAEKNTDELRSPSIGGGNKSAKEHMKESQSSPQKEDKKKEEQALSLVIGEDKSAKETINDQRLASSKEKDVSAKEGLKEQQTAPVEGKDNIQGNIKPVMDDHKSPTESVETPHSPEVVNGREDTQMEKSEEIRLAALKLEDEATSDKFSESEPEVMSFDDMVNQMQNNAMDFERDEEDKFEMLLVAREKKKNKNIDHSQNQTMAEWTKAVERRNLERHGECCHMDAPCTVSSYQIKTEATFAVTDKPCQEGIDKVKNVDSPGKMSMDEGVKERNQPSMDTRTLQTLPNREEETSNSHKNQAVDNRGSGSFHLDDPLKHTVDGRKQKTNQPYANRGYSSQHTSRQRERERRSPYKIKESDRSSSVELSSRGSNNSWGRNHNYQVTGHRKADKYNQQNDSTHGGESFNRMSSDPRSLSRDTNIRSDNRGREQNWGSANNHCSSHGQHPTSGEDSTYRDAPDPSQLISILSEYRDFRASLLELLESNDLQPATIRKTVNTHSQILKLVGETVEFRPKLAFCNAHIGQHGCQSKESCYDMHLCPVYVRSYCHDENCMLGHKLFTHHNKRIFRSFYMQELPHNELRRITKLMTNTAGPLRQLGICKAYNESKCSKRNCDDIHICQSFVAGRSKCSRSGCPLNHNILNSECSELLKRHGYSTNEAPRDVVLAFLSANSAIAYTPADKPPSNSADKYSSDKRGSDTLGSSQTSQMVMKGNSSDYNSSRQGKSSKVVCFDQFQGDSILAEICFYSVEGKCRNENIGCPRLHSSQHYHWQVSEQGTSWFNLCLHQVTALEHVFCDPVQEGVMLPQIDPSKLSPNLKGLLNVLGRETWRANFEAMILTNVDYTKILYIRRLCTERIIGKTLKQNTYVWYFLDKNNKWVRYGNVDSAGEKKLVSSVSSAEIERHFLRSPSLPLIFQNAAFTYSLDFSRMTQRNQQTKIIRKVRRRPESHVRVIKK